MYTGIPVLSVELQNCTQEYPTVNRGTKLYPGVPLLSADVQYYTQEYPHCQLRYNTVPRSTPLYCTYNTVSRSTHTVSRCTILYPGVPPLSVEVQYCTQEYPHFQWRYNTVPRSTPTVSRCTILYPGVPLTVSTGTILYHAVPYCQ